jgi:LysM repeat protein
MTFARLFAVVVSLHVTVIGCLLVQSGCQTISPATDTVIPTDRSVPPAINAEIDDDMSEGLRLPPTRPAWDVMVPTTTGSNVTVSEPMIMTETVTGSGSTYTVKKGDSLWALSKRFGVSVSSLASSNGISSKANLKIGQTLIIPDGNTGTESVCAVRRECAGVQAVMIDAAGRSYKVRSGDSLSRIAQRHHTTVAALKSINGLSSDNIRVGQELLIPGKHEVDVVSVKTNQPVVVISDEPGLVTTVTPMTPSQALVETGSKSTPVNIVNVFDEQDDSFFDEDFEEEEVIPLQ